MKNRVSIIATCLIGAGLLAVATFVSVGQKTLAAEPPTDPAHAAHVAAAANQAGGQTIEAQLQTIAAQMAEMVIRIERLEAIAQQQPGQSPPAGGMSMGAGNPPRVRPMPGLGSGAKPASAGMAGMDRTGGGQAGMGGDPAIVAQLAELHAKMQRLEAAIQPQSGASSGAMPMSGKPGTESGTKPMQGKMAGRSAMGAGNPQPLPAERPTDPAHTAHVAAAASQAGGQTVDAQLAEIRAKIEQLEGTIQQQSGASSGAMPMSGKPGTESGTKPMKGKMGGMSGMGGGNPPSGGAPGAKKPAGRMGGMGGAASPPGGKMGMMDKMKGGMGGGAMPADSAMGGAAPDGGGGSMQPGQSTPASGGLSGGESPPGVDADMTARLDKMIGMMDKMVRMMDRTVDMLDRMTGDTGGATFEAGPLMGGTAPDGGTGGGSMPPEQAAPPMGDDMQ